MADEKEIWICAFCDTQFCDDDYCLVCVRYDGAMLKADWEQFNLENPRVKAGA